MGAEFDVYVRRNTWLYALDPRVKLALVAEAILFTFLWTSVWAALAVAAACLLLLWLAQVPVGRIAAFLRGIVPLLLMVLVLTSLFAGGPGPVLVSIGPLRVTVDGVMQGLLLASRLLALGLAFFFWLSTTDQAAMVRGFVALRMPYTWGLTLALALRYLPILAGLFEQVREAQQARGLDLRTAALPRTAVGLPAGVDRAADQRAAQQRTPRLGAGSARVGNTRHPALGLPTAASAPHGSLGAGRARRPAGRGRRLAHVVTV